MGSNIFFKRGFRRFSGIFPPRFCLGILEKFSGVFGCPQFLIGVHWRCYLDLRGLQGFVGFSAKFVRSDFAYSLDGFF